MSADRWKRVNDLFYSALEIDQAERSDFLRQKCPDDPQVVEEVESLLAAHQSAEGFVDEPLPHELLTEIDHELLLPEDTIGVYKILKEIGHGGMGAVYLAARSDQAYEKQVAIKLLKRGMDTAEVLRHFRSERQILAAFDHPHIARLLDGGTTQSGLPYFVMEYVNGLPIDQYCDENRLSISQRLELFRQICGAVAYAHRHLVIHRDIKPTNILVTQDGTPKLLDFGIAKILDSDGEPKSTVTGIRMMTPEYASPEQVMGLPVTTVSDVYSLGVVLYELLTGHSPYSFGSRSPVEIAQVIDHTEPLLPSTSVDQFAKDNAKTSASISTARNISPEQLKRKLRGDLDNIVLKSIRKDSSRRYQSVEEFSEDIRRYLTGLPILARKDTIVYRVTKFARRNRIAVGASALLMLSLIAGIVATTWQAKKAKAEQMRAEYAREFAEEVRYIETLLLSTYTAPVHDVRHNLKLARERLKQIEQRMLQGGPSVYGSGNHALGNGYLMLKEYERAKSHLETAWNAGYQEPATAYALGKALGILYLQALSNADRSISDDLKERMIREAQAKYAQPAVQYLARARGHAESPAYLEGLIALYEKRFEDALRKTAEAARTSSRPDEVAKLEGDIHFEIARQAGARGEDEAGRRSFALAGRAYERAAEVGSSDTDVYLAQAQMLNRAILWEKGQAEATVEKALELCEKAAKINSDNDRPFLCKSDAYIQQGIKHLYGTSKDARVAFRSAIVAAAEAIKRKESSAAHQRISRAYLRIGEYETNNSLDPREALNHAIQAARKAIAVDSYYTETYLDMAAAYFYIGEYELNHGGNPIPSLSRVIDIYDKDLKSLKKDAFSYNLLGLAYLSIGEYKLKRGIDAGADLQNAIANGRLGLKTYPRSVTLLTNLGLAFADIAKHEMRRGIDPTKSFDQAIAHYNKALGLNPDDAIAMFNRALTYATRAEHKLRIREDPAADIDFALAGFEKAMESLGELPVGILQIGFAHVLKAAHRTAIEKNPTKELVMAKEMLAKFVSKDSSNPEAQLLKGKIDFVAAQWAARNGQSPDRLFDDAIVAIEKSIEMDRYQVTAYAELSSLYRHRAEWSIQKGKPAEKWVELGLQKIDEAEKIYPNDPEILETRKILLELK